MIFPHIVVWGSCFLLHLLAPPSSFLLLPPPLYNISHTTSHTQHLSQQHHSHNISHTTSHTQHHSHNIPHTTSLTTTSLTTTSLRQHPTHNISHNNISHTTSLTQHPTHNVSDTTSLTQHLSQQHLTHNITHTKHPTHNITHATSPTRPLLCCLPRGRMYALASSGVGWAPAQISWQAQHFAACQGSDVRLASSGVGWAPAQISWQAQHFAACPRVGCTPWRRLASAGHRRRFRGRRSTLLLAKGSDVRPGVVWRRLGTGVGCTPWRRLASAGHRRRFRGRRSTLLLAKGSDVRPGVVWRRLGIGADFVAGAALCCLPRGRMYALASSGVGWAPAQISWQAQHFAACQGVGCTPWRRLASAGQRRRFRGRRSTLLLAQGSDVRPGVVWRRLSAGADFVAGAALCCLPRGRMYALASSGVGWAPAQISWQAQHFAACPRVGCTPWRRLASAGHRRRFRGKRSTLLLAKGSDVRPAGTALCCLPRGRMYALASSGVGWAPAQISWQAQHFAACQGVGCTPWRRLASAGHRRRFRGRRSTLLLAKGSDVRPGVVWRRLGTGADFVAGAALCCLPRVGCTPWRRLASAGHRRRFRGRHSTFL